MRKVKARIKATSVPNLRAYGGVVKEIFVLACLRNFTLPEYSTIFEIKNHLPIRSSST